MIKYFERSTVERIEENSNGLSRCLFIRYTHNTAKGNKKVIDREKKPHYTGMAVLLSLILPWKRKEKKLLQQGVFVFGHPPKYYLRRTGLNFVEQTKHVAVLVVY